MRNLSIAAIGFGFGCAACAGGSANTDTASVSDTAVVAGPAVSPSTQPPADSSAGSAVKPAPSGTGSARAGATTPPAAEQKTDSVRGIVAVVGTSFDKHVMIADRGTQRRVEIVGTLSSLVGHVSGAEVEVVGVMSGTQLNASRFLVRSVDNQAAIDGTLRIEGGSMFIVTADGTRTRIATPPPPFVGHEGARVWITGDPAKAVSSFGFIDPPR